MKPKPTTIPNIPTNYWLSPTWPYVLRFALEMEARLALPENRAKGDREGWVKDTPRSLLVEASRHALALADLCKQAEAGDVVSKDELRRRAVNAANFLMMTADAAGALVPSGEEVTQPNAAPLPTESSGADDFPLNFGVPLALGDDPTRPE